MCGGRADAMQLQGGGQTWVGGGSAPVQANAGLHHPTTNSKFKLLMLRSQRRFKAAFCTTTAVAPHLTGGQPRRSLGGCGPHLDTMPCVTRHCDVPPAPQHCPRPHAGTALTAAGPCRSRATTAPSRCSTPPSPTTRPCRSTEAPEPCRRKTAAAPGAAALCACAAARTQR